MKSWLRNNSYYYRYLISYIMILIVPIIFIAIYVNGSIFRTLEQEIVTNDLNALTQLQTSIESTLEHTRKIKEEIYLETYNAPFIFMNDPLRGVELINELKSYTMTNPFIDDIFLYFRGDDYIYRSSGSAPLTMFMNELYHFEEWDEKEVLQAYNNLDKPLYRPSESVRILETNYKEMSTILYPLHASGIEPYAVVIFAIPQKFYDLRLDDKVAIDGKINVILNDGNEVIAISDALKGVETAVVSLVEDGRNTTELSSVKEELTIGKEAYLIASVESDDTGWVYLSLTPKTYINDKIKEVRYGFIMGIGLVILIGLIGIVLSMRVNYSPIRKLRKYSASLITGDGQAKGELELVRNAIDYLHDQNLQLSDEVEHSSEANKQYIAMQLIRGTTPMDKGLLAKAAKYGVSLEKYNTVAVIYVDSNADYALTRKEIIEQAKDIFSEGMKIYAVEHFDSRKISLIMSFEGELYGGLQKKLEQVQKSIKEQWNVSTTVGVGNCYTDKQLVPKAYIEALTAVDYRLVKGNGCVIFYKDMIEQQVALGSYPQNNLDNVGILLKSGNIEAIEKEVDIIIKYIKGNKTPIFIAKGLCFDIINIIFRTSQEIVGEFYSSDIDIPDVFALSQYDTVDELAQIIKELSHDLCWEVIKQKEKEELSLIHEMVIYIKNNYTDDNFSLHGMADFFGMSQSSLSMYFKEKTEQKIIDYITRMKIDKAKELLTSTSIPLSKLAEAIGYTNVTSFIRRFKQVEAITPGEYRKKFS